MTLEEINAKIAELKDELHDLMLVTDQDRLSAVRAELEQLRAAKNLILKASK